MNARPIRDMRRAVGILSLLYIDQMDFYQLDPLVKEKLTSKKKPFLMHQAATLYLSETVLQTVL
jgi:hypothetical protein